MTKRGRWTLWAVVLYAVILAAVAVGLGGLYAASHDWSGSSAPTSSPRSP